MKTHLALALSFFAALTGARADLTIVSEIKTADVTPASGGNMTMKLAGGKVRVDTGPAHIIILPAEEKMLVIVDAQKMCMVKSLKNPSSQASKDGEPPAIERTGKKETISGFDCEQVLLKDKKGRVSEIWVSPAAPDMTEFVSTFKTLARINPKKNDFEWSGLMSEKDLNRYPIRAIRYNAEGKEETRITVLSINHDPVPASVFVKPDGYQEMQMPDFGGQGGTDIASSSPSSPSPAPANPMQAIQEMQKKMQSGQAPSQEDIKKMQDMAKQLQQQMQAK